MICLANTCKPKGYFWPVVYPWCREHLQTDRDTVPSVLLPSWYVNILRVPRWGAAAGKAAWEGRFWEWDFCTMGKEQDGQGLWQGLRGHCVLTEPAELHPVLQAEKGKLSA